MATRPFRLAGAVLVIGGILAAQPVIADDKPTYRVGECAAPEGVPTFAQDYIDMTRAGGEPIIDTLPDGTLVWGSHAGTTHIYGAEAADEGSLPFLQNYNGQTYYYWSDDNGAEWHYVNRDPIRDQVDPERGLSGMPVSGFSDPDFAVDLAGNVFVSEINLANIAVSRSDDGGRSYVLQSMVEITASDRQWMEADEEDVLYFVANTFGGGSASSGNAVTGSTNNAFYKSVDGGVTFSAPQTIVSRQASSDIKIDRNTGAVYQLDTSAGNVLGLIKFPNARNEMPPAMTFEQYEIALDYRSASSIDPTLAIDAEGNLYVTWADKGSAMRDAGVYYTYSTDGGETWLEEPIKVTEGDETAIWSWIYVGEPGKVAISWIETDRALPDHEQENGTGPWHVWTAMTHTGLGCEGVEGGAGFVVTRASGEAPHTGQICSTGTTCEARAVDRRLGDYFSHTVDADGNIVVAISDTNQGGAIALPLMIRQIDGPTVGRGSAVPYDCDGETLADYPGKPDVTDEDATAACADSEGADQSDASSASPSDNGDSDGRAFQGAPVASDAWLRLMLAALAG